MSAFLEAWAWSGGVVTAIILAIVAVAFLGNEEQSRWWDLLAVVYLVAFASAFFAAVVVAGS